MKSNLTRLGFYITILLHLTIGSKKSLSQPCTQAPNITYNGVINNYLLNNSITNLIPINIGGTPTASSTTTSIVSTLAGNGISGYLDLQGNLAEFHYPYGVVVDTAGIVYVTDRNNSLIRKISKTGLVSTIAGNTGGGNSNGQGTSASFSQPMGILIDALGNLIVVDKSNNNIRKITPNGFVSLFAGNGIAGSADGQDTLASFYNPVGIVRDTIGNLYISDALNNRIRKINPNGIVSTFAGSGYIGSLDGQGLLASFYNPADLSIDSYGNIYVADLYNYKIRKISPSGMVTTIAGNGNAGNANGYGLSASFSGPKGLAIDHVGNIYVCDALNNKIRKITSNGLVSTWAGTGVQGSTDGINTDATFNFPSGITIDSANILYVADANNHKIRKIEPATYSISPSLPFGLNFNNFTGIISGTPGYPTPNTLYTITTQNGCGTNTTTISFSTCSQTTSEYNLAICATSLPYTWNGLVFTSAGTKTKHLINSCGLDSTATLNLTITQSAPNINYNITNNHFANGVAIQQLIPTNSGGKTAMDSTMTKIVSSFAGNMSSGNADGMGIQASFYNPIGLTIDKLRNIYVADYYNNKIRKITSTGLVTTLAGSGAAGSSDGSGIFASFNHPYGLAVDTGNNIIVADSYNNKIRKITPNGIVTTIAGTGGPGNTDGGASLAKFNGPSGVAIDMFNNIFVADQLNHRIRKISPPGIVSTFAGSIAGNENGPGNSAKFDKPTGIAIDTSGNLFVTDLNNHKICKISPSAFVSTYAGNTAHGLADGNIAVARFYYPNGIAIDSIGNLYIGDMNNSCIRQINTLGYVNTLAGKGYGGLVDGNTSIAAFSYPAGLCLDNMGSIYVADQNNNEIRKISELRYKINPSLQSGLSFDIATGIIFGTPVIAFTLRIL